MRHVAFIVLGVIMAGSLSLQMLGAWQDSPTRDEPSHMVDGLAYWQLGTFEFNYPHPPLAKILPGLALYMAGARIDTSTAAWKKQDTEAVNAQVLYSQDWRHARYLTFIARLPMLLFSALLISLVWGFTKQRFGAWPALAATALIAFDPNLIGHGPLVNTDIPMTAMFFASALMADKYFRQPTTKNLLWLSVVMTLAVLTKFSAVVVWPLVIAIGFGLTVFQKSRTAWRQWWRLVGVSLGTMIVLSALVYQFEGLRPNRTGFPVWAISVGQTEIIPWPSSWWRGLYYNLRHDAKGHRTVFRGQVTLEGSVAYFPTALITKTPIPTLLLWAVTIIIGIWWLIKRGWPRELTVLALFPTLYAVAAFQSNLNLGIRHIFPLWPFFAIAVAWLVHWAWPSSKKIGLALIVLSFVNVPVAIFAYPGTISYFNGLAGGTEHGSDWFVDSNTDWGQDAWRVAQYLEQHPGQPIHLALFNTAPRNMIAPGSLAVPVDQAFGDYAQPLDRVILSDGLLEAPDRGYAWIRAINRDLRPERIGTTVTVFHF